MRLGKEQAVGYVEDTAAETTRPETTRPEAPRADVPATAEAKTGQPERMPPAPVAKPALPVT